MAVRSQTLGEQLITNLLPRYSAGAFREDNWELNYTQYTTAPAACLATLAKYTSSQSTRNQYINMVEEILTDTIANFTDSNKHFQFAGVYGDLSSIDAVSSIGWILNKVPASTFSAGLWASWLSVCQTNCDFLDLRPPATSDTTFYINGNYNCHLLEAYWYTYNATSVPADKARYLDMYERAYAFVINPAASNAQWIGYGLIVDVTGAQSDWSDYQAHFTETNGYLGINPSPNFDPNYTTLTIDLLSRLWQINNDVRLLRLINSLMTKDEPFINTTTWIHDGTSGSRQHNLQPVWYGYYAVSALLAHKTTNRALLDDTHIKAMWDNGVTPGLLIDSTTGFYSPGTARQLELAIAPVREAASDAGGNATGGGGMGAVMLPEFFARYQAGYVRPKRARAYASRYSPEKTRDHDTSKVGS